MSRSRQNRRALLSFSDRLHFITGMLRWAIATLALVAFNTLPAQADPPVFISNSTYDASASGNRIASIGAKITYELTLWSDSVPLSIEVQDINLGKVASMPAGTHNPPIYRYKYLADSLLEGKINGTFSPTTFITVNASGVKTFTDEIISKVTVDNQPPLRDGPLSLLVNSQPYTGQTIHLNDVLTFSQTMDSSAYQAGENAQLDYVISGGITGVIPLGTGNPHTGDYTMLHSASGVMDLTLRARDPNGNSTYSVVLEDIPIDSIPPVIVTATATVNPAGTAYPGSSVTVKVTLAVDDGDSVTASCTYLGGTNLPLTSADGITYQGTFIVASSPPVIGISDLTQVDIKVTDDGQNIATASTDPFQINNMLPEMPDVPEASIVQAVSPTNDSIGVITDFLTVQATATWNPVQYPTAHVYIDLTSIGGAASVELSRAGEKSFYLNYQIPVGISEEAPSKTFRVWAIDTATGNTIQQWTIPGVQIDNVAPKIVSTTLTRVSGSGTSYTYNDQFKIVANISDLGTAEMGQVTVNLASLSALYTDLQPLNQTSPGVFQGIFTVGSFPAGLGWDLPAFDLNIVASDHAGNITLGTVNTGIPIDNEVPTIKSLSAAVVGGGSAAIINSQILFRAKVEKCNGIPTVDISSIGGSNVQQMTSIGSDWYEHLATVNAGSINGTDTTWIVTAQDTSGNTVSSTTNKLVLDNMLPQVTGGLQVRWTGYPTISSIKSGINASFTITITDPDNHGTSTIDLTALGWGSSVSMDYGTGSFSKSITTTGALNEYTNYEFIATITDLFGNPLLLKSSPVSKVDCLAPTFASCGILISEMNGDNPVATIANNLDVITVYASITNFLDEQSVTVALSSGATLLDTGTLSYVTARNRHEANFTIQSDIASWSNLDLIKLTYQATATDNVGNTTSTSPAISDFSIKTKLPIIDTHFRFWLSPDFADTDPTLNIGSSTTGDLLYVIASFSSGDKISSAVIDLSQVPGAPATYALNISSNGITAWNTAGISFTGFTPANAIDATFTIILSDQAGNQATASRYFLVDTQRPSIATATFDGTTAAISIADLENIENIALSEWKLVGSSTSGTTVSMPLTECIASATWFYTFEVTFGTDAKKLIAQWDPDQPIWLEVTSVAKAPLTDPRGNWLPGYSRFPVTIPDSAWRQRPTLTSFVIDASKWSTGSMSFDLVFNQSIDFSTLVASDAVFLVSPFAEADFPAISYNTGYVLQKADIASNTASNTIHIDLCADGRDWFARKLGSGTAVLRFANRSAEQFFIKDLLGRPMQRYPATAPFSSSNVVRPAASGFGVSAPSYPPQNVIMTIASGTIDIALTDRALLYYDLFRNLNGTEPLMGMPIPTALKRTTRYNSKLILYDAGVDPATYTRLTLNPLDTAYNKDLSSTSMRLNLTDEDMAHVLALFRNNPTPTWLMQVESGAFGNWWDQPSRSYLYTDAGEMQMEHPATTSAKLVAAAISDPPLTKNAAPGSLFFEFDFAPDSIGNTPIPIASLTPSLRLISSEASSIHIASGSFIGWTTRTVEGKTRYTARFSNLTTLTAGLEVPGKLEIWNVKDAFGNDLGLTATTTVYDLSRRSDADSNGFATGTQTLLIDTRPPTVTAIDPLEIPNTPLATRIFSVTFSEPMDPASGAPVLLLATGSTKLDFFFLGWNADGKTASYTNADILDETLAQGNWEYRVLAGGADMAANAFGGATYTVYVSTQPPSVSAVTLQLTRRFLSATSTVELPRNISFNPDAVTGGTGEVKLTYGSTPVNLPHRLRFINTTGASWTTLISSNATATISAAEFGAPVAPFGPASYLAQVYDTLGNVANIATFVYDSATPSLDMFSLANVGSEAAGIYYAATSTSVTVSAHAVNAADSLLLTAYSSASTGVAGIAPGATATFALNQSTPGTYTTTIGSMFAEGDFDLSVSDLAGNIHMGHSPLKLRIDRTQPTVFAVSPTDAITKRPTGTFVASITFLEPMNGDPAFIPSLTLATSTSLTTPYSSSTIFMTFDGWISSTTAQFRNAAAIDNKYRPGTYTYNISGGRDLAGNTASFTSGSYVLNVQAEGPAATSIVWTQQPHLTTPASKLLSDMAFSPDIAPGVATIALNYETTPSHQPHELLILDGTGKYIATYPVALSGTVASITVTISPPEWNPADIPPANAGPLTYRLQLRDSLGNISDNLYSGISLTAAAFTYDTVAAVINSPIVFSDTLNGTSSASIRYYSPTSGNLLTVKAATTEATDTQRLVISNEISTSTVTMAAYNTDHSVATGTGLADGLYTFSLADLAGNMADGTASTALVMVDSAAPSVVSVTPAVIGSVAARSALFDIEFSEPMYTASVPAALLATTSGSIALVASPSNAGCWISSTTCRFTNVNAITGSIQPQGQYDYVVSGARDYAGNKNTIPSSGTRTINISSVPPSATLRVSSRQQHLFGNAWLMDMPYSYPANNDPASLTIAYTSAPANTPQKLLVYDLAGANVATYAVPAVSPFEIPFDLAPASWPTPPNPSRTDVITGPASYSFKLVDSLGNLSPALFAPSGVVASLTYDSRPADVSSFALALPGYGIASAGISYYSPAFGNLTANITTDSTDGQRLVIHTLTATAPVSGLTSIGGGKHSLATGSSLVDGLYTFTAADLAGNMAIGAASTAFVMVDASQPVVISATPLTIGSIATKSAIIEIEFSEPMQTLFVPVVTLATTTGSLSLVASPSNTSCWLSPTVCRFTNEKAITADHQQGLHDYVVSGARDYAGNENKIPASGTRTIDISSKYADASLRVSSRQQHLFGNMPLYDMPYSYPADNDPASLTIAYTTNPANVPQRLLIYDSAGVNVATYIIPISTPYAVAFDLTSWPTPQGAVTGPASYTFRIIDTLGNITPELYSPTGVPASLTYDSRPADVSSFAITLPGNGIASAGINYYSPLLGNLTAKLITDSADGQQLVMRDLTIPATYVSRLDNLGGGTHQVATGSSLADGAYAFMSADLAGNMAIGVASATPVVVDSASPTVISVSPATIGSVAAKSALFDIEFSEPMQTAFVPVVMLATTSGSIPLVASPSTGACWISPTTCRFTNQNAITDSIQPQGLYDCVVSGARDYAGNVNAVPASGTRTIDVSPKYPRATLQVSSRQQHLFGNSWLTNMPYSYPADNIPASLTIAYTSGPINTPQNLLMYNTAGENVATYLVPAISPFEIAFDLDPASWPTAPLKTDLTCQASYTFKLVDSVGNISPALLTQTGAAASLTYDTKSADVSSFAIKLPGTGIASEGINYYSPLIGNLTVNLITDSTDGQQLVMRDLSTPATYVSGLAHLGAGKHNLATGSTLFTEGLYAFTAADLAGNMAIGAASTAFVLVDASRPVVLSATPLMQGSAAAKSALFDIEFSEPMQMTIVPSVTLATISGSISLVASPSNAACWISSTTCRFTNQNAITDSIQPQGLYDYVVSGAYDYAGNSNVVPASGTRTIEISSKYPAAKLRVSSRQQHLFGNKWLPDMSYSYPADNDPASLTIDYTSDPLNPPQYLMMYNAAGENVATYAVPAVSPFEIVFDLDPASWPTAPSLTDLTCEASYTFKLVDSMGNLSPALLTPAGAAASLTYDSKPTDISSFGITLPGNGIASSGVNYYSSLLGDLTANLTTDSADRQQLVIRDLSTPATYVWGLTHFGSGIHRIATGSSLADGLFAFTAADLAGNMATGTATMAFVIVDRIAPSVTAASPSVFTGTTVHSLPARAATFTLTFDEAMASNSVPLVRLVQGAFSTELVPLPGVTDCWISSMTCQFTNKEAITATFPQGIYSYDVTGARDYAGNANSALANGEFTVEIQSRGPIVKSYVTRSKQFTTGSEELIGQPFSHLVAPNAATLTVTLETASGSGTFLHFLQNSITVASVTLTWDSDTIGSFTWDNATGPIPANGSPYTLCLVDQFGNPSLETGIWTMDATAPIVLNPPSVFGGRTATGTTYTAAPLTFRFQANETQAPRLRVWTDIPTVATDTYTMIATSGAGMWSGTWNLYESRDTNRKATDGVYLVDIVDAAGNVGTPSATVTTWPCRVVLDSSAPAVATYVLKLNGNPVSRFAPAAASLTIEVTAPTETLSETGIFWVDVLDRWSRLITRLPLIASGSDTFVAKWNGTNSAGMLVTDDYYILVATDYAGNRSTKTATIFVSTAGFRVISATEITSSSADLRFSLPVMESSVQNTDFSIPGLSVASFSMEETTRIRLLLNTGMTHGAHVPFTVNVGSITSEDLVPIAAPGNIATLSAVDAQGPVVSNVTLSGLAGPNYFKAVFDEPVTQSTAETASNYTLTASGRTLSVSNVKLQADGCSVTASASETLAEGTVYQLAVDGVEDRYRNRSRGDLASFTFHGADVTAPAITLAAFSNPGNERDIIIAVKSSESLLNGKSPSLTVTPSTGTSVSLSLNQAQPLTWTAGYHLDSNVGSVVISVNAQDEAGNTSTKSLTFTIATVNANVMASLVSADGMMTAGFDRKSLRKNAFVKILPHELDYISSYTVSAGIKPKLSAAMRGSVTVSAAQLASQASELVPIGLAYEISMAQSALRNGFGVTAKLPAHVAKTGVALYRQSDDQSWQAVGAEALNGSISTTGNKPGTFALLRDIKAPRLSITTEVSSAKPMTTARPRFEGRVEEYGSGLNADSLIARVDGESAQPVTLLENGSIVFVPIEDLTGGSHDLVFEAEDLAGNKIVTPAIRFAVQVPLAIGEISIYPNPARIRSTIRISANRRDVDTDLIDVHIYDTAGHRVRTLSGVRAVREAAGASARFLYDLVWDLRNGDDETVANGVYLAKVVIRDPDNPNHKVKKVHKIAVLR